jgi:hypothetical protein
MATEEPWAHFPFAVDDWRELEDTFSCVEVGGVESTGAGFEPSDEYNNAWAEFLEGWDESESWTFRV